MMFTKVRIENFGLYSNIQEFDFTTSKKKNIILIGGQNGNGKTTLFEAIRFCLYGPAMFQKRLTSKEYESYLKSKIHHNVKRNIYPNNAAIEVNFEYVNAGHLHKYCVNRSWKLDELTVEEEFKVEKDGELFTEVESDQWQTFISDLIPPGLAELFFFDGEKIQNLANDSQDNKQMSDSFKSLLGIDLIERLQSDLEIFLLKQIKQTNNAQLLRELGDLEKRERDFKIVEDDLNQEIAQIQSKIDGVNQQIVRQEGIINSEGGSFSTKRTNLKNRREIADKEIEYLESEIRKLCEDTLPLALAPNMALRLKDSLEVEETVKEHIQAKKVLEDGLIRTRKEMVKSSLFSKFDENFKITLVDEFIRSIHRNIAFTSEKSVLMHNLSEEESKKLISLIELISNGTSKQLIQLTKRYEVAIHERHTVERELGLAPSDGTLDVHLKEINQLHQELGSYKQRLKDKNEELKSLIFQKRKKS